MFSLGSCRRRVHQYDPTKGYFKKSIPQVEVNFSSSYKSVTSQIPSNMIYYSLDPQFATLLFSIYSRNERVGFSILPDTLCFTASPPSSSSILSYAHTVGLQLIAIGEHYANFLTQVRAGSVIFLVGVGSLVCWKLWDYWNGGGNEDTLGGGDNPPTSPKNRTEISYSKTSTKRTKDFLASFLEEEFVHDFEDFEDEDPALIQQLLDLGRLYIKNLILGKYFGPESPLEDEVCADNSPLTSEYSGKTQSESARQYLADNSASYSADEEADCLTSDVEDLPFDDFSVSPTEKRNVKRRHRMQEVDRSLSSTPSKSPYRTANSTAAKEENSNKNSLYSNRFHPYGRGGGGGLTVSPGDLSSSDTSPRGHPSRLEEAQKQTRQHHLPPLQRLRGDGSETPDSEEFKNQKLGPTSSKVRPLYANCNSDEEWTDDARFQPDGEEEEGILKLQDSRRQSRELSLSEMITRFRQKNSRRSSLSRDNSVSSRLSDFLRRDDSICSNLSDFAYSECSELSLELSIKDESIANHTISSLADIEDELNTLKSSVLEIDEEFFKFASRPNPYLLKTTFTDYSYESSDSRPGSALDLITYRRPRTMSKNYVDVDEMISNECKDNGIQNDASSSTCSDGLEKTHIKRTSSGTGKIPVKGILSTQGAEAEMSLEWDSPQHGWSSSKKTLHKLSRRRSSADSKISVQEDAMPSLEWDHNGCLKQYDEENKVKEIKLSEYGVNESPLDRYKYLPDHSSLELDLEEELQSPKESTAAFVGYKTLASPLAPSVSFHLGEFDEQEGPLYPPFSNAKLQQEDVPLHSSKVLDSENPNKISPPSSLPLELNSKVHSNPMTTSVDSAIHSAPGSRSGSSSPLPHLMTQSMMSSGIATSWSELNFSTPDSESGSTSAEPDKLKRGSSLDHGYKLRRFWSSEESGYVEGDGGLESSITNLSPVHEIREKETLTDQPLCNVNLNVCHTLEDNSILTCGTNDNSTKNNNNIMGNNSSSSSYQQHPLESTDSLSNTIRRNFPAIGEKVDITSYAFSEWNGSTKRAQTIRKGYTAIPDELDLSSLRRIRGDNYCGIRAVLFQVLTSGLAIPSGYQVYNRLLSEINRGASWLRDYTFGKRISCSKDQVVNELKKCLDALDKLTLDLIGCENRENVLFSRLNNDTHLDVQICEAAKLHMLACSLDLFREEVQGRHVPLFAMIMFARETSSNPKEFLLNHLNPVGDSAGLEQIEMFLLGHSLQVTLQVVRPSSFGCEDFICFYPDENIGVWPEVTLVAEDDRHYNVLVK